jgi:hypothetical protein
MSMRHLEQRIDIKPNVAFHELEILRQDLAILRDHNKN